MRQRPAHVEAGEVARLQPFPEAGIPVIQETRRAKKIFDRPDPQVAEDPDELFLAIRVSARKPLAVPK
jgi:hypothetical protein